MKPIHIQLDAKVRTILQILRFKTLVKINSKNWIMNVTTSTLAMLPCGSHVGAEYILLGGKIQIILHNPQTYRSAAGFNHNNAN